MRQAVLNLEESRIREVANAGMGRDDVLAFWFGESDEVTPEAIRQAAADSLLRGETFYSHNLGLGELRAGLAAYASRLHGPIDVDRVAVTSSGVNALMLAIMTVRELPEHERRAWQQMFAHYIFEADEQTAQHVPAHARGVLSPMDANATRSLRARLPALNKEAWR